MWANDAAFHFGGAGPDLDESHRWCDSHLILGATPHVLIRTQSVNWWGDWPDHREKAWGGVMRPTFESLSCTKTWTLHFIFQHMHWVITCAHLTHPSDRSTGPSGGSDGGAAQGRAHMKREGCSFPFNCGRRRGVLIAVINASSFLEIPLIFCTAW